jgi:hypothetical protein
LNKIREHVSWGIETEEGSRIRFGTPQGAESQRREGAFITPEDKMKTAHYPGPIAIREKRRGRLHTDPHAAVRFI